MNIVLPLLLTGLSFGAPPPKRLTDAERGKELYERHCLACHGATTAGDGPASSALVVPVPDLREKVEPSAAQIEVVRLGRGAMPAFEASFDDADARRVLQHMAKLRANPAVDAPAPVEPSDTVPPADDAQAPEGGG